MEELIISFVVLVSCIIGVLTVIYMLTNIFSKKINGKEHIEQYMSEKYGEDWLEKCLEIDKKSEVIETTDSKHILKIEINKDLLIELYNFAYEEAAKNGTVEKLQDIDRRINSQ